MICHERRFIFIHICRCAGSSIEEFFKVDIDKLNKTGDRHARPRRYKEYWEEYFTFVSVRNPWDRVVSAFQLSKQHNLKDTSIKQKLHNYDLDSFNSFVKDVLLVPGTLETTDDRLFWPQSRWLLDGSRKIAFDMTVRFETLSEDLVRVGELIGVDMTKLPHALRTERPSYRDVYDQEGASIVEHLYRDDIDLLGYRF